MIWIETEMALCKYIKGHIIEFRVHAWLESRNLTLENFKVALNLSYFWMIERRDHTFSLIIEDWKESFNFILLESIRGSCENLT